MEKQIKSLCNEFNLSNRDFSEGLFITGIHSRKFLPGVSYVKRIMKCNKNRYRCFNEPMVMINEFPVRGST